MYAIITVGISASGKTTYAKEMEKQGYRDINRDWIRFNLVKPGATWKDYKFSYANEKSVSDIQGKMIMESASNGENIVISDTNLSKRGRESLIARLDDLGYTVKVVGFPIAREEAVKRDNLRANGVGQDVIYRQWLQWNEYIGRKTYTPDEELPSAILVDVDGTIADMAGKRGPFDWGKVGGDLPRWFVIDMVRSYYRQGYEIIILSGRSDECKPDTEAWLAGHGVPYSKIHMRKSGDFRKDSVIKEEIFWTNLADKYNIVAAIDDRPMMIRAWSELKIPNVIAVANPYIEF